MDAHNNIVIFQSTEYSARKSVVSCLMPNTPITKELLDLWSVILNYNENLKSRGAPSCFFASTSLCDELFFDGKRKKEASYKKFAQLLDSEVARLSDYELKQITVFLFPVSYGTFSGLFCVVPDHQKFTIIDSASKCKDAAVKRAIMPRALLLRQSLSKYLGERKLVKNSKLVGLAVPDVINVAWTEGVDEADIGLFTMRHMETFKGVVAKGWNHQLKRGDKEQLKLMRKRYSCVIACAPNNKLKEINLTASNKFHSSLMAKK